ncbi:unnamed protein product, partial [Mesorhabditis belari]|uniref:BTB domain-containing protein n=1 Tax=Mesorhabditis belari TaxID=2138241 RepID=A0AAF3F5Z5_9BILA
MIGMGFIVIRAAERSKNSVISHGKEIPSTLVVKSNRFNIITAIRGFSQCESRFLETVVKLKEEVFCTVQQARYKAKFAVFNTRNEEIPTTVYTGTQQLYALVIVSLLVQHLAPQDELQLVLTLIFDTGTKRSKSLPPYLHTFLHKANRSQVLCSFKSMNHPLDYTAEENGQGRRRKNVSLVDGISHYTETTTRMEQIHFINKWSIEQFSVQQELCPPGESVEGSCFGSGPYKFQLRLYPSGKDEDCSGYISLYLLIKDCPSSRLSFRVNFSLDTLDGPRNCALNKNVVTINRGGIVTASKFFSLDSLKSRGNRLLPDDTLTVSVELVVFGELHNDKSEIELSDVDEEPAEATGRQKQSLTNASFFLMDRKRKSALSDGMQQGIAVPEDEYDGGFSSLLDSGELTDFSIICGNNEIKTHRAVLFARSGYFQGVFRSQYSTENQASKVELKDIDPDVLTAVVNYMYTLNCPQISSMSSRIARAADRFIMPGLKSRCEAFLLNDVSAHNVSERLKTAYELQMNKLKRKTVGYFARNREEVVKTEEWKDLRRLDPELSGQIVEDAWKLAENNKYPSVKRRRASETDI